MDRQWSPGFMEPIYNGELQKPANWPLFNLSLSICEALFYLQELVQHISHDESVPKREINTNCPWSNHR